MSIIQSVFGREILDSRGSPTIEVEVKTSSGFGRAQVPSGASTGEYEAVELRDVDKARFFGKGVLKAVSNVNQILAPAVIGMDALKQFEIDRVLIEADGTKNKSKLGANAILGVSMAVARAAADSLALPLWRYLGGMNARVLPTPLMNILNGGKHADSGLEFQEFMIVPSGIATFEDALRCGAEVFHALKIQLQEQNLITSVGDEGGFAPRLGSNEKALQEIMKAIERAGYKPGKDVYLALDCAASEFYDKKNACYTYNGKPYDASALLKIYETLISKYPIASIEDPFAEDDWDAWRQMTLSMDKKIQIVGDDLFVTNTERLSRGIEGVYANAILIKVNQIGTVSETLGAMHMASKASFRSVVSHRSGETEDSFIADFAVGTNAGQIKTGSLSRSDRIAKYNQLLRISSELGSDAVYAGYEVLRRT